jgi:NAD(P)-dependent dehydrogenase (short-subunit alcohol dehydrogenase family)
MWEVSTNTYRNIPVILYSVGMKLSESVIIVTGAAKRIGNRIARDLASQGACVVVHCHTSVAEADETVRSIREQGGKAVRVVCDLREVATLNRITQAALDAFGRIDGLVNCASVFRPIPLEEVNAETWNEDIAIHQSAPFFLSRLLYEAIKQQPSHGCPLSIVNISDSGVFHPGTKRPSYYCAKNALLSQTHVLAASLAPQVRVNAIAPGPVQPASEAEERLFATFAQQAPLKQLAQPQDIVRAVRFLMETDSITGQIITIDGGRGLL